MPRPSIGKVQPHTGHVPRAQHVAPGCRALAIASLHGQQLFVAELVDTQHDQHGGLVLIGASFQIEAVGVQVHVAPAEWALLPGLVLLLPVGFQFQDAARRQRGRLAHQRAEDRLEVTTCQALQIEPCQQPPLRARAALVARDDVGVEAVAADLRRHIADSWQADLDSTHTHTDGARGQVTIAIAAVLVRPLVAGASQEVVNLQFQRSLQHLPGALTRQHFEHVIWRWHGCGRGQNLIPFRHGVTLLKLARRTRAGCLQREDTPLLSPFRAPRLRPISTSAHNSSAPFLRRPYAWQRLGSTGGHLVLRGNQCQLTTSCPFAWITVRYLQAVWLGDAEPPRRASHGAPQSSSCRSACTLVNPQMLKPGGVFRGGRQRQGYLKKELRNSPPFDTSGEVAIRGKLAHDECSGKAVSGSAVALNARSRGASSPTETTVMPASSRPAIGGAQCARPSMRRLTRSSSCAAEAPA